MIIAYSKVSSKEQDQEKFRTFFIMNKQTMSIQFDDIILEQVSATKTKIEDRKLWNQIKNPDVKKLVVTEISRIGINTQEDGLILLEYITKEREDLEIFVVMSNPL